MLSNSGVGQQRSNAFDARSRSGEDFLTPRLKAEADHPEGYTPQQMAYMNTASQDSLGGGVAATTGEANLTAARTRNSGGFQGAVGTANRGAQRQLSENALKVQTDQANLQQMQKQQALESLQKLYGVDTATAQGYLEGSTQALGKENEATGIHAPGFNLLRDYLQAAETAGSKAAAAGG